MRINPKIKVKVDKGYIGILKYHANTAIPNKSNKGEKLSKEEKRNNRLLSKQRIGIEHVNRKIKIFRILKETYRNHKKFAFRATLIAAIFNANLISDN